MIWAYSKIITGPHLFLKVVLVQQLKEACPQIK